MEQRDINSNYYSNSKLINLGQEDQMTIIGYKTRRVKQIVTWIFIILTIGLLRLVFYWRPDWMVKCMCCKVNLESAEYVILEDQYEEIFVERVKTIPDYRGIANLDFCYSSSSLSSSSNQFNKSDYQSKIMSRSPSCDELSVSKQYFMNKKIKYIWNDDLEQFEKLKGLDEIMSYAVFHEKKGLTQSEESLRQNLYGNNSIIVSVTPIVKLLFTQALHPFYIFQLFSCALWYSDQYGWYATCILVISIVSLTVQIYQTRSMQRALKSTITPTEIVSVYRPDKQEFESVLSDILVPGDVIEVPKQGCVMQCDAVLLNGNCIVNESMLTGESIPVTKTPIPQGYGSNGSQDVKFSLADHSRHVLFSGTHVIQTRYYGSQIVKAVVIRTGFSTAKGELVRSILYPKPVDFKFTQDGAKYIGVLALIALGGMIYTLVLMAERGDEVGYIITRTLDLLTIVIPPALPAAMTIGIVFAQKRLRDKKVFCISPRSINLCGAINVFCFDKTGTLTEDGLDLYATVPALKQIFQPEEKQISTNNKQNPLVIAMATCHSLTIIEGCITGDPLDVKMFEATSWVLEEPGEDTSKYDVIMPTVVRLNVSDNAGHLPEYENDKAMPYEIGILRQFTFSSKLQRMSVITRELNSDHFDVYAKGSPEMIASLCNSETVPADFHDILTFYTQQGYRVIAFAHRLLSQMSYVKINRVRREEVECGLTFLGLLIMENRLKPETLPIIRTLKTANIRTVMVTGDNMLTALSVARDCQMIDRHDHVVMVTGLPPNDVSPARLEYTCSESIINAANPKYSSRCQFAITGQSWTIIRKYFPEVLPKLAVRGVVFSRFSPENKQQLIELLQETGYYVGMCGDGANDCGALKTAHAGISLSEAEASVASPFTSKESNISCVPNVIKEGRAALVTSYGIFKFMACYSLTQFLSVCLLYWIGASLTDFTFLYIDLLLLTSLGITFCYTSAYFVLDPNPPKVSLVAVTPILSLVLQLLVHLIIQLTVSKLTKQQPWFEPFIPNEDYDYQCYEVTIIFLSSSFQYITMAIVFSKGPPYRKMIFTNYVFMVTIILCTGITIMIVVYPFQWIVDLMELKMPPTLAYRGLIVGIGVMNFIICFITENYVVDFLIHEKFIQPLTEKYINSKLNYRVIENEIYNQPDWPPISNSDISIADLMRLESLGTDSKAFTYVDEEENKVKEQKKPDNELSVKSSFSSKLQTVNEAEHKDIQNLNDFLQNGHSKDSSGDLDNLLNVCDNRSSNDLWQDENEDGVPILPRTMSDDATLMLMTSTNYPSSMEIKVETNEESLAVTIL